MNLSKINLQICFILVIFFVKILSVHAWWDMTSLRSYPEIEKLTTRLSGVYEKACLNKSNPPVLQINAAIHKYDGCGKIFICNATTCLSFHFAANVYSKIVDYDGKWDLNFEDDNEFLYIPGYTGFSQVCLSNIDTKNSLPLAPYNFSLNYLTRLPGFDNWYDFQQSQDLKKITKRITGELSQVCLGRTLYNAVIIGQGNLPNGCTDIKICLKYSCLILSKMSFFFAEFRKRQFNSTGHLSCTLKSNYSSNYQYRAKRAAIHPLTTEENLKENTRGLLRFNIPGYRYCGPGTDIDKMDSEGGPINDLDAACRDHDLDYLLGTDPSEADRNFLEVVRSTSPYFYPLFLAVFRAKQGFESVAGRAYTSYLYFYPNDFHPSLTLYFSQHSSIEDVQSEVGARLDKTKNFENRWTNIIRNIWQGSCNKQAAGEDKQEPEKQNQAIGMKPGTPMDTLDPPNDPNLPENVDMENEEPSTSSALQPTNPKENYPNKCFLLLNEIFPTKTHVTSSSKNQFVELCRKCGDRVHKIPKQNHPEGYMLIFVDIGSYTTKESGKTKILPAIVFSADLSSYDFNRRITADGKPEWYITIGHGVENVNVPLRKSQYLQHVHSNDEDFVNAIPHETYHPTVALLLYFKVKDRPLIKNLKLTQTNANNEFMALQVTDILAEIIRSRVVDAFTYGQICTLEQQEIISKVYEKFPHDCNDGIFTSSTIIPHFEQNPPQSFSRCSDGNAPFLSSSFKDSDYSPGGPNICLKDVKIEYPFDLKNIRLQTTAQKLLLNLWSTIKLAKSDPSLLEGEPRQVAAKLTGVEIRQLTKANQRWRDNRIMTPGKQRQSICKVQITIDSFDRDWLRGQIVEMYKSESAPTARVLYDRYYRYKIGQIADLNALHESDPEKYSKMDPFRCSLKTFKKVLKLMGFKYGRVDKRAAILQQPHIIRWRGKYLRRLRENRASPTPMKIVFIDETWIDTNMRIARGWVPRKCQRFKDMSAYTYSNLKVGKGPRLIVLSAIMQTGVIQEVIKVYPVAKSASSDDYHDNVDAERFHQWYTLLLDTLDKTGEKYIIIMDNASYHSKKVMPKKSSRKQEIYDWLKKQQGKPGVHITLPDNIKSIRKFELEEMLDKVTSLPNMNQEMFQIDQITSERGHEVLRLPPYNCDLNVIELVWKDVKHNCRTLNVEQKLAKIQIEAIKQLENYDKQILLNHWLHVEKLEQKYWEEDGHLEQVPTGRLVIRPDDFESDEENPEEETIDVDHANQNFDEEEDEEDEEDILDDEEWPESMDEVEIGGDIIVYEECDLLLMKAIDEQAAELASFMEPPPKKRRGREFCPGVSRRLFTD